MFGFRFQFGLGRREAPDAPRGWVSTYEELRAAPAWSMYGIGRREKIPQFMPSVIADGFYMVYLAGIAFGYTAVIMRWTPYIVSVCMALVMLFITWVKKKWENFTVHRFGIWWSPQKVLLGDFLCPKGGKPIDLAALQADAAAFESEAWIPLARLQHITKTRLNRGAERRSGAV